MLTVVIATTTIFCAFTIQESIYDNDEEEQEQDKTKNVKNKNKTPTKRSAKENKKCPNEKSKKGRVTIF